MDPIEAQRRKLEKRLQNKRQRIAEETGKHAAVVRGSQPPKLDDDDDIEDLDDADFESDDALEDASLDDLDDIDLELDDDDIEDLDHDPEPTLPDFDEIETLEETSDLDEIEELDGEIEELGDADFEADSKPVPRSLTQADGVDFSKIVSAVPGLEDNLDEDLEELDEIPVATDCPNCAKTNEAKARLVDALGKILLDMLSSEAEPTVEQRAVIAALEILRK